MAVSPSYQFKIAAGLNNAAGLVNVETLTDGERSFYAVTLEEDFILRQPAANGIPFERGYQAFTWKSDLWRGQYAYLFNTILSGSLQGYATFQTLRLMDNGTYSIWQGVLTLPDFSGFQRNYKQYQGVLWQFTRCTEVV